jgi:hypothetical protein
MDEHCVMLLTGTQELQVAWPPAEGTAQMEQEEPQSEEAEQETPQPQEETHDEPEHLPEQQDAFVAQACALPEGMQQVPLVPDGMEHANPCVQQFGSVLVRLHALPTRLVQPSAAYANPATERRAAKAKNTRRFFSFTLSFLTGYCRCNNTQSPHSSLLIV